MAQAIGNQNNHNNTMVPTPLQLQQEYCEMLGEADWYEFKMNEHYYLQKWLAYALYGVPTTTDQIPGCILGYDKSQSEEIKKLYDVVLENHFRSEPNIFIRLIYIVCTPIKKTKSLSQYPVLVVKKCEREDEYVKGSVTNVSGCLVYIDHERRIYKSWGDYLKENRLPACLMHCPKNGKYTVNLQAVVELEVVKSPASTLGKKFLVGTDITGAVVGTASTGVLVAASAFTVAPVVVGGAVISGALFGVYSVCRSIATLVDRKTHRQSIGLDNNESRLCWLNTTVGTLGTATSAATAGITMAAKRGIDISRSVQVTFNTLQAVTAVGNGVNIVYSVVNIIQKKLNDESISALEVFQLCSSIFFFYQSTINFKTAKTIISETQGSVLQDYQATLRSNRHRRVFRKAQLEAQRINGEARGNSEIIRGIQNINDPDNFFAGLVRINKHLNEEGTRYTITENGNVALNSAYIIDPAEFANMPRQDRQQILTGLPSRQPTMPQYMPEASFNARLSQIQNIVERFVDNNSLSLLRNLSNVGDFRFYTSFLLDLTERSIEFIFEVLDAFLSQIHDELNAVANMYPSFSKPVIAIQFLVNYLREKAIRCKLEINKYIQKLVTEEEGLVNSFVKKVVDEFRSWNNAVEQRSQEPVIDVHAWATKNVQPYRCSICSGIYFKR